MDVRRTAAAALLPLAMIMATVAGPASAAPPAAPSAEGAPVPAIGGIDRWQRGASIPVIERGDLSGEPVRATLRRMRADGLNAVSFIIPLQQATLTSSVITRPSIAPSDADVESATRYARSLGLSVMYKIHADVLPVAGHANPPWRAHISPADRPAWFASYRSWLLHYAGIGQRAGATDLCLGVEMAGVTTTADDQQSWRQMITAVRAVFDGALTYGQNWSPTSAPAELTLWNDLDYIGLSAYYPLATTGRTADLVASWAAIDRDVIAPLAARYGKPVVFTEVGYRSIAGAAGRPYDYRLRGAYDEPEQARDYDALIRYWSTVPHFAGVQWWHWYADPGRDWVSAASTFSPQGKAAEQVLQRWFLGRTRDRLVITGTTAGQVVRGRQSLAVRWTGDDGRRLRVRYRIDAGRWRVLPTAVHPGRWSTVLETREWEPSYRSHVHSITVQARRGTTVIDEQPVLVYRAPVVISRPTADQRLTGPTTLLAGLPDVPLDAYAMAWRVDGGAWTALADPAEPLADGAQKQARIDPSRWAPNGGGKHRIEVRATDRAGVVLATGSVRVRGPA